MRQAKVVCEEILKLNENDNLGSRYLLFAILAYLEEEKELLKLYKKYYEESFMVLFPVFVLNYKLGNEKKANEYFVKFINGTLKPGKNITEGYYSHGDSSEILMYFNEYTFLLVSMQLLESYVKINTKKKKTN